VTVYILYLFHWWNNPSAIWKLLLFSHSYSPNY